MSRRKRHLSRKRRALRRCALLALLVALSATLESYRFLLRQAVRVMAEQQDVEHPVIVHSFYDGSLPASRWGLWQLVDGDRSMMLCYNGWNPLAGWYGGTYAVVETWNDPGISCGIYGQHQGEQNVTYFYGKVDAEHVERLTLTADLTGWDEEAQKEQTRTLQWELGPEVFFEKDGSLYFCRKLAVEPGWDGWNWQAQLRAVCTTGDGRTLTANEVGWRSWSTV